MRNLRLYRSGGRRYAASPAIPQRFCVREDLNTLLVASQNGIVELNPDGDSADSDVPLTPYAPQPANHSVLAVEEFPERESVCVATASGDILLCHLATKEVECVGSVEGGLSAVSWSPDRELVLLVTARHRLVLMTRDFEPVAERRLHQLEFGADQSVSLGWGKKETQFHGSEGKESARRRPGTTHPSSRDDGRPRVTWRGDGLFFAVGAVCPETGARKIRVWNRELGLQATSEPIPGLEPALSWKPSGNLIASTREKPTGRDVVFLEKNGLLRGQFPLPFPKADGRVLELLWNPDSTLLAVWLEELEAENSPPDAYVQLWTSSNYHWYLKQTLRFGQAEGDPLTSLLWDRRRPRRLHVLRRLWTYYRYDWDWKTDDGIGDDGASATNVAVVDGDKVLITPFHRAVVPPPMCTYTLRLPRPVNQVTFHTHPQRNGDVAVLDADDVISVYRARRAGTGVEAAPVGGNAIKTGTETPYLDKTYRVAVDDGATYPLRLRFLTWLPDDSFLLVTQGWHATRSTLHHLAAAPDGERLDLRVAVPVDGEVITLCCNPVTRTVALQLADGQILRYLWESPAPTLETWLTADGSALRFPYPCFQTSLALIGAEEVILGLSDRRRFILNSTEVASNVTSFAVSSSFLALTTDAHACLCCSLKDAALPAFQACLNAPETHRKVERGARVVALVPADAKVVLQMPRGNLETVHHRALVLGRVRNWLDRFMYKEAFQCMRKQRIDLNLLYDHNPEGFLENTDSFIRQLDSVHSINLFLTELKDENPPETPGPPPAATPGKLNLACDALLRSMQRLHPRRYFLASLTAHVKKNPPELEIALRKIHQLQASPPPVAAATPEDALEDDSSVIHPASPPPVAAATPEDALEDDSSVIHPASHPPVAVATPEDAQASPPPVAAATPEDAHGDSSSSSSPTSPPPVSAATPEDAHGDSSSPPPVAMATPEDAHGDSSSSPASPPPVAMAMPEDALASPPPVSAATPQDAQGDSSSPASLPPVSATTPEDALDHLLSLTDGDALYRSALATYDLPLILMVAQRSQKDPKEYLPFLNALRVAEPVYRRSLVDRLLKRYARALAHLSRCGPDRFPEFLHLMKEWKGYGEALRLYPIGSREYEVIAESYGDYLAAEGLKEEAALMFHRAGALEKALYSYRSCGLWRESVAVATALGYAPRRLSDLARSMAEELSERGNHTEAATLLEDYAQDPEGALHHLLTGNAWSEALRLIYKHGRWEFLEENFTAALLAAQKNHLLRLESLRNAFRRHRSRLRVVREEEEAPSQFSRGFSLPSSTRTAPATSSPPPPAASLRFTQNRRKKTSLREGNPSEHRALLEALWDAVAALQATEGAVRSLLRHLVRCGYDDDARSLQRSFLELWEEVANAIPEIWPSAPVPVFSHPLLAPDSTTDGVSATYRKGIFQPDADELEFLLPPKLDPNPSWKLQLLQ
ncbi:elongator complex protein 1 isoform 2-T2 [Rhynochetos jubatus]